MEKVSFKNLSKKQKVILGVVAVVLLASGVVGSFFGLKKLKAPKSE